MTDIDRRPERRRQAEPRRASTRSPATEPRAGPRAAVAGGRRHAGREVEGLRRAPCAGCCGRMRARAAAARRRRGRWPSSSVDARRARARRSSATAPTSSSSGVVGSRAASTSPRCTTCSDRAVALYVGSAVLSVPAGLHPRRRRAAHDVPAARRRRGQAQPPAAQLRRPPAARRPAQPGHQRHRQRRPEPAADAEPDAHVGAARSSACSIDDVHRSRRCWRWSRSITIPVSLFIDARSSRRGPGRGSSRSGRTPASLNAQVEETFTGHAIVKAFGRQREVEERFRDKNDELYEAQLRRAVHVEHHPAGDDVPRQPATTSSIAVVGGLRVVERRDHASATSRRSSSTPASSPSRSPSWRR